MVELSQTADPFEKYSFYFIQSLLSGLFCSYLYMYFRKCVKAILEHDDWKKALRTSHPTRDDHGTIVPETPVRLLVKKYPDLAELVFNSCICESILKDPSDTSTPVKVLSMNYEFIDDAFFIKSPDEEGML